MRYKSLEAEPIVRVAVALESIACTLAHIAGHLDDIDTQVFDVGNKAEDKLDSIATAVNDVATESAAGFSDIAVRLRALKNQKNGR